MRRLACVAAPAIVAALVLAPGTAGGSERTPPGKEDYGC
jgi:hypothetical protein